jgi:DNA-binding NarL/FixJ family response regulator
VIKILVADDHPVVRRGLRQILEGVNDMHVAGEAATPAEVIALVDQERWDVLVLDVSLKGGSGLEILPRIKRTRPELGVVILSVFSEEQYAVRAIRSGASGYLTKESAPEKLVDAVQKVAAGGRYVSPELAETLASLLAGESAGAPHERLSNRELQVLISIASGKTVSQIAETLGLSVKTISTHRTRILRKMRMKTNAELMLYGNRSGLVE